LPILIERCQKILNNKISSKQFTDAKQLRNEILGKFSELFATDGFLLEDQGLLDYYEVNFNHAFQCFRITILRPELKELEKLESESVEIKEETGTLQTLFIEQEIIDTVGLLPQEKLTLLNQLWCFIRLLPEAERDTLILYYVDGHTQDAIAAITGVDVRTVRNRKNSGINKIKNQMED
jgi:RNA polymerase sigma factor (sigma-70 family)